MKNTFIVLLFFYVFNAFSSPEEAQLRKIDEKVNQILENTQNVVNHLDNLEPLPPHVADEFTKKMNALFQEKK